MSGVCDYCGTEMPTVDVMGRVWGPAANGVQLGNALLGGVISHAVVEAEHYRQHIEELLAEAISMHQEWRTTDVEFPPASVIPDSWQGPRIQQLRGDNT